MGSALLDAEEQDRRTLAAVSKAAASRRAAAEAAIASEDPELRALGEAYLVPVLWLEQVWAMTRLRVDRCFEERVTAVPRMPFVVNELLDVLGPVRSSYE